MLIKTLKAPPKMLFDMIIATLSGSNGNDREPLSYATIAILVISAFAVCRLALDGQALFRRLCYGQEPTGLRYTSTTELKTLREEVDATKHKCQKLRASRFALQEQVRNLKSRKATATKETRMCEEILEGIESKVTIARQAMNTEQEAFQSQAKSEEAEHRATIDELEAEKSSLQRINEDFLRRYSELSATVADLEEKKVATQNSIDKLESEMQLKSERSQRQTNELCNTKSNLEHDVAELQQRRATIMQWNKGLEDDKSELRASIKELEDAEASRKEVLSDLEHKISNASEKAETVQKTVESLAWQKLELEQAIRTLEHQNSNTLPRITEPELNRSELKGLGEDSVSASIPRHPYASLRTRTETQSVQEAAQSTPGATSHASAGVRPPGLWAAALRPADLRPADLQSPSRLRRAVVDKSASNRSTPISQPRKLDGSQSFSRPFDDGKASNGNDANAAFQKPHRTFRLPPR